MIGNLVGPRLLPLVLYGAAMGWLEGVVVVYIRGLLGIAHGPVVVAPAAILEQLRQLPWLLPIEQGREAATLVMLGAVAWLSAVHPRHRVGSFLLLFGIWDIVYYVALYAMLRWPPSLATLDVLFLIPPGPWWTQPVWVPVAISMGLIATGLWLLRPARTVAG